MIFVSPSVTRDIFSWNSLFLWKAANSLSESRFAALVCTSQVADLPSLRWLTKQNREIKCYEENPTF